MHAFARSGSPLVQSLFNDVLYLGLELGAVAACAARAVRVPRRRAAWTCIALAAATWTAGDVVWTFADQSDDYPSFANTLYLACYPLAFAGFVLLLRGRERCDAVVGRLWIDGAIGGFAIAAIVVALVWDRLFETGGDLPERTLAQLAFPICDLILVAIVLTAFATQTWRPARGWLLLGIGGVLLALADTVYLLQVADGSYREGELISVLWPATMLCWAWAAWQPWRPEDGPVSLDRKMFAFPAGFALSAVALLFYGQLHEIPLAASLLAFAALLLGVARASSNYVETMRLLDVSQREARTDGLTGLPNRRALMDDLAAALADGGDSAPRTLVFFDLDGFKLYNDGFGHVAGDILLSRLAAQLVAVADGRGVAYRLGGDEFCVLLTGEVADGDALLDRCLGALSSHGEAFTVTASHGVALLPSEAHDPSQALGLADQRMYARKDERRPAARRQTSDVLMQVLREREPELHDHSDGVTELALAVGRQLGLPNSQLDEVARAAELHDIGKIAVPEAVLHKPGPLDDAEWQLMRQHTVIGDRILSASPAMRTVSRIVRASHERWDGRGYPDGLAGEQIPLGARIVAVCDSYSAMTSERPYQQPLDHAAALNELRRCAGSQFDAQVVAAFCAAIDAAAGAAAACAAADAAPSQPDVVRLTRSP